jgi:hypothetical protein
VDYSYFINDAGKYSAKRLPSPKLTPIKIKDITDLSTFRYELIDSKPSSESEFWEVYNEVFDSIDEYEVEIAEFEEVIEKNKANYFNSLKPLKKHIDELLAIYEPDELSDEYEWTHVKTELAKSLNKAKIAAIKPKLDDDDWYTAFDNYTKVELQAIAKPLGIKVSQTKPALIKDLIEVPSGKENIIELPSFIKFDESITPFFENLQKEYIQLISEALKEYNYPRAYQAAVWTEVADINFSWPLIVEQSKEKLEQFEDIDGASINSFTRTGDVISGSSLTDDYNAQNIYGSATDVVNEGDEVLFSPSVTLLFDYTDSKGVMSSREFRLDKIVINKYTYLHGFCFGKRAARHFRLDRIIGDITFKDTGEIVSPNDLISTKQSKNRNVKTVIKSSAPAIKPQAKATPEKKITLLLFIGILFIPLIFSWFTLRKGHSTLSRCISFGWLILSIASLNM